MPFLYADKDGDGRMGGGNLYDGPRSSRCNGHYATADGVHHPFHNLHCKKSINHIRKLITVLV